MTNIRQISKIKNYYQKHRFNHNFFDNGIQSSTHAWVLGWCYGDGSIYAGKNELNTFQMALQFSDMDVLQKFSDSSVLDMPLGISMRWQAQSSLHTRPQCKLQLYSQTFATALNDLGCTPNKSQTLSFPHEMMPHEYMADFVRGYMEADGSLILSSRGEIGVHVGANCCSFFAACWMPETVTLTWDLASMASMASIITKFVIMSRVLSCKLMNS